MTTTPDSKTPDSTAPDSTTSAEFHDFYREQFPATRRFLIGMGATFSEAEDAAQNAMLSYFQLQLRPTESILDPPAWIRVVARNNWLTMVRRLARAVPSEVVPDDRPASSDTALSRDPATIFQHKAQHRAATDAMRGLPPTQRAIVALVVDGWRPNEIAEKLGSDPAVVRSNLARARRRLRSRYRAA